MNDFKKFIKHELKSILKLSTLLSIIYWCSITGIIIASYYQDLTLMLMGIGIFIFISVFRKYKSGNWRFEAGVSTKGIRNKKLREEFEKFKKSVEEENGNRSDEAQNGNNRK